MFCFCPARTPWLPNVVRRGRRVRFFRLVTPLASLAVTLAVLAPAPAAQAANRQTAAQAANPQTAAQAANRQTTAQATDGSPADAATAGRQLQQLERQIERSRAKRAAMRQKSQALGKELKGLRANMVSAAQAAQENEAMLSELENQLDKLKETESRKEEALNRRAKQMSGVLAALQRLALHPTSTLLVQPQNPADTVRSAILLGAAVPEIKRSIKDLRHQIALMARLKADIADQRTRIKATAQKLEGEHRRLHQLYKREALLKSATEAQSAAADQRAEALASKAGDLRDLLARLEVARKRRLAEDAAREQAERAAREAAIAARSAAREAVIRARRAAREAAIAQARAARERRAGERKAAEEARRAEMAAQETARRKTEEADRASRAADRAASGLPAPMRLRSFVAAKGSMPFPARGIIIGHFGHPDDHGVIERGITIQTRPDAEVVSPFDGRVVFAGRFRGYGLLLIIEHSEGYHTLLAGLGRIDVTVGQHLVAGEPVGVMGRDTAKPALYVELRHDGRPVNPLPWLSAHRRKVRG